MSYKSRETNITQKMRDQTKKIKVPEEQENGLSLDRAADPGPALLSSQWALCLSGTSLTRPPFHYCVIAPPTDVWGCSAEA